MPTEILRLIEMSDPGRSVADIVADFELSGFHPHEKCIAFQRPNDACSLDGIDNHCFIIALTKCLILAAATFPRASGALGLLAASASNWAWIRISTLSGPLICDLACPISCFNRTIPCSKLGALWSSARHFIIRGSFPV
jgi:hypothetical protein